MKTKKYLWCNKCKKYPDEIEERYTGQVCEIREWDGTCYELTGSNLDTLELDSHCTKCGTLLIEK